MRAIQNAVLVFAVLASIGLCQAGSAVSSDREANRKALTTAEAYSATITADGQYTLRTFFNETAGSAGLTVIIPDDLEHVKVTAHEWKGTNVDCFLLLADACHLQFASAGSRSVRVVESKGGLDPRCRPGGTGAVLNGAGK